MWFQRYGCEVAPAKTLRSYSQCGLVKFTGPSTAPRQPSARLRIRRRRIRDRVFSHDHVITSLRDYVIRSWLGHVVKCDTFPLLYRELDFTCWHHSPRHHLYDYCFSWCRSGNLLRGQNFLYWSQFSRLLFYCRVGFFTPPTAICRAPVCDAFASPCAMSRPHARHQNYTSPCANPDGAHTIAPSNR